MNIQVKPQTVTRPLLGRTSLITGSTSGIGLGIAHALARAGSAIVLNGLDSAEVIEPTRASLATDLQ